MKVRGAVLHEHGCEPPYARSRPLQVMELELERPGPSEVLVDVMAAGLCHSDLSVIDGSRPWPLPMLLGHEASGVVRAVGTAVRKVRPGDHVVFTFVPMCGQCVNCLSGKPYQCQPGVAANRAGTLLGGSIRLKDQSDRPVHHHMGVAGFSTATVVNEASVVPIDSSIPLEVAAVFGCAIMTGVGAVVNTAGVRPGTAVAIFGMGGVGLSALMGARVSGAWPIVAVDISDSKLTMARRLGATHVLNPAKEESLSIIRSLTDGGADVTFEAVGNANVLHDAYLATRPGGTTVSIGLPPLDSDVQLKAVTFAAEERRLQGSYMGSSVPIRDLPRYFKLYRAGLLPVDELITSTVTLDEINEGFDALREGEQARQVLKPNAIE